MTPIVQRYAVTLDDGTVSILSYLTRGRGDSLPSGASWVPGTQGWWDRPPRDDLVFVEVLRAFPGYVAEADDAGNRNPRPVSWRAISEADVPGDRTYRDALRDNGESLAHDMVVAREIHRERLRHARAPMLSALDVAAIRADEAGDAARKAAVISDKQRLRDVTGAPEIEAAQSVEELAALRLGVL